jgi:hypothetical protein
MGHYIRVLGVRDRQVPIASINAAFRERDVPLGISVDRKGARKWTELEFSHTDGTPICSVERNEVKGGGLGGEEISEFLDEINSAKPASAAKWLMEYLPRVRVIYAIQIYSRGADRSFGWAAIDAVRTVIWEQVGGIIQADWEGFSNEEGYHILWQFSEGAKGSWCMAVLDADGRWTPFRMELGDRAQRRAYLRGQVPAGAERL